MKRAAFAIRLILAGTFLYSGLIKASAVKMAMALVRDIFPASLALAVLLLERKLSGASGIRRL